MSHLHSSMVPLDSNELATRNEHKKIADRLKLKEYRKDEQVSLLIDELDRLEYLLQLERIESAGTDKYHKKLVALQNEIEAKNESFDKLESEHLKLKQQNRKLKNILMNHIERQKNVTPANLDELAIQPQS
ncbi:hypothetical protein EM59_016470 [Vibrio parahaemolyticus]|uniref:hypothetical protein n=1 Tax=Vibrio parahaemolyticus TaxID=670 RepID=UPI0004D91387|nr:hypothetical protein [Vibrio parahaemolyticus]EGQ7650923.1 hypothetical protein [Vibrio parahaemolyticus]EGQ9979475.1 hypothetical protein [Vibrio parahaemolyticus]EJG1824805.1 hypothetical protein [Vibrio parahaemolyticus]ELB2744114.1 hypothetical protein [Vibrio parahaemolyticus]ELC9528613.1 hypothetical protein [Vibrio parahaemolyticus]